MQIALVDTWRGCPFRVQTTTNDDILTIMRDLQKHVGQVSIAAHQVEYQVDEEAMTAFLAAAQRENIATPPLVGYRDANNEEKEIPTFETIPVFVKA